MTGRALERYLAYHVLGETHHPRAPRRRARQGPPRSRRYLAWIRTLPCAVCGADDQVQAAHTGTDGGLAQKPSDYSAIPLCALHHTLDGPRAYHGCSRAQFEARYGLDCAALVHQLNRHCPYAASASTLRQPLLFDTGIAGIKPM